MTEEIDSDTSGLISGQEIDTSILSKYFPSRLVNRKTRRSPSWRETQPNEVSSSSSLSYSSEYESDRNQQLPKRNQKEGYNKKTWSEHKNQYENEEEEEDNTESLDKNNNQSSSNRFQQLTKSKIIKKKNKNKKSKPSKKARQRMSLLVARKEHAQQIRKRSRAVFEDYGSTFLYAAMSLTITSLALIVLGYSHNIQPIISLQLWILLIVVSAVFVLFLVEAYFASRPLFIKQLPSTSTSTSSSTSAHIKDQHHHQMKSHTSIGSNVEMSLDALVSYKNQQKQQQDSQTSHRSQGHSEGHSEGQYGYGLKTSLSQTSIDIYDADIDINDDEEAEASYSYSHRSQNHDDDDDDHWSHRDNLMRTPQVPLKQSSSSSINPLNEQQEIDPLSEKDMRTIGVYRASDKKLSPMSTLEAN